MHENESCLPEERVPKVAQGKGNPGEIAHLGTCPACLALVRLACGEGGGAVEAFGDGEIRRILSRTSGEAFSPGAPSPSSASSLGTRGSRLRLYRYAAAACILLAGLGWIWTTVRTSFSADGLSAEGGRISLGKEQWLEPDPGAQMEGTGKKEGRYAFTLIRGGVYCVDSGSQTGFLIRTTAGRLIDVGTRFRVESIPIPKTDFIDLTPLGESLTVVEVDEGMVDFRNADGSSEISAGHRGIFWENRRPGGQINRDRRFTREEIETSLARFESAWLAKDTDGIRTALYSFINYGPAALPVLEERGRGERGHMRDFQKFAEQNFENHALTPFDAVKQAEGVRLLLSFLRRQS